MTATDPRHALLKPGQLEQIKGLSLVARRVVEGAMHGLHRSPQFGLSVEFAQHREYTPGDELKHLDWQVLARSDRYVVKQYEQETNLRAVVLLDASRSMDYAGPAYAAVEEQDKKQIDETLEQAYQHSKFRYGQVLAAACAHVMLQQGDSVGLMISDKQIRRQVAPRAAAGHLLGICRALLEAEPDGETDIAAVITQLASRLVRRSLVIVISDLFDEPDRVIGALGQLHHRGHEVIAMQVLDPHEWQFDLGYHGRGMTVVRDMETNTEFEAEPHLIRELVQQEVKQFLVALDHGAKRQGFELLRCPTTSPPDRVLSRFLRRRTARKRR
jgi:uncharacterized protein (DUF58 family)